MNFRLRFVWLFALAALGAAAATPMPAHAQFWGFGYQPPARRAAPSHGFFSFPFFERGYRSPYGPYGGAPAPVDSSRAPPPRKQEAQPTRTVVVIGDSMADWLAYGLEEVYADRPDLGVVRKIRANSGLIHYEPRNDTLEWSQAVKDILAGDKPSAIVVMLGLNDRVPLRNPAPPREPAPRKGEPPAQTGGPAGNAAKDTQQQQKPEPQQQAAQPPGESAAAANNGEAPEPAADALRPGMYEFHSEQWAQLYRKRIDDMIAALKAKGVPVLWVGLPAIRGSRSTADMGYLDDLYHAAADKAGIRYVDIWDGFVDENGRYSVQGPDFEGQTRRLRSSDGVHFTKFGALKLAHLVDQELGHVLTNPAGPAAPLPGPEAAAPAKPGAARPAIGPVLPLAATAGGGTGDLLGAKGPAPAAEHSLATSVLVRGDALPAPPGRADDFSWPPRGGAAIPPASPPPAPAAAGR
jgi:lysophospholipase L1-like esterase